MSAVGDDRRPVVKTEMNQALPAWVRPSASGWQMSRPFLAYGILLLGAGVGIGWFWADWTEMMGLSTHDAHQTVTAVMSSVVNPQPTVGLMPVTKATQPVSGDAFAGISLTTEVSNTSQSLPATNDWVHVLSRQERAHYKQHTPLSTLFAAFAERADDIYSMSAIPEMSEEAIPREVVQTHWCVHTGRPDEAWVVLPSAISSVSEAGSDRVSRNDGELDRHGC
ncbi:hypothetical protein [Leeia oryzae]|uniref:hypothetical protein n=1 Tax=Leeia oryzae TaxID=356662 RepID=UPI00037BB8ED|nr:hypothetical protein [Leeia oryzae]